MYVNLEPGEEGSRRKGQLQGTGKQCNKAVVPDLSVSIVTREYLRGMATYTQSCPLELRRHTVGAPAFTC